MTLYRKEGRKYIPIRDTDALEGLSNGSWLITVKDGSTSIRQSIKPNFADVQAACQESSRLLIDKLLELNNEKDLRSPKRLTEEQAKVWNKLQKLLAKETVVVQSLSVQDVVNEFLRFVEAKVIEEFGEKSW